MTTSAFFSTMRASRFCGVACTQVILSSAIPSRRGDQCADLDIKPGRGLVGALAGASPNNGWSNRGRDGHGARRRGACAMVVSAAKSVATFDRGGRLRGARGEAGRHGPGLR